VYPSSRDYTSHPSGYITTSTLHTAEHEAFVNFCMEDTPDLSGSALAKKVQDNFGIALSVDAIRVYRCKLGWTQIPTRYCQMIRHFNKEKRVTWCQEQLLNKEQFDDVIFS
jgi:hypothetical protein